MDIEGAVIACAGYGSRLGQGIPKCMVKINGKTILSRLIELIQPITRNINIVVGYRKELIVQHCRKYHSDITIIDNPDYHSTNTAHSIRLGSKEFKNKVLYLDGDLIIEPSSLKNFIRHSINTSLLVGITSAKSSEAVFVTTDQNDENSLVQIYSFQREPSTNFEWANIFIGSPKILDNNSNYVYESFKPFLPLEAFKLDLYEIDTPDDLALAKDWIYQHEPYVQKPQID